MKSLKLIKSVCTSYQRSANILYNSIRNCSTTQQGDVHQSANVLQELKLEEHYERTGMM
jgi:hypothetical protein